ncbi:Ubiquitin-protein ligase E3A [Lachnellula occidentalis]|uniref:HECT-type E3 ubiquitin transferase n=1 Tax=Lachnellula occidentalis TaxID=215460 RepID=A0A8H8U8B4_9HELO|nr:Ubiquitin-protein ligase E3A [Lachnellula occidentalis]
MTRDIQRLHDEHDPATEDEVYAALWATSPFPRLPPDAPEALKKVTIDIDDPRRIRYGCTLESCNTSTCFSSRKRVAGGAPVRRYNATSARTLAVYMASQDNPEQGLCHHPSANRSLPQVKAPSKPKKQANGSVQPEKKERLAGRESSGGDESRPKSAGKIHPHGSDTTKGRTNSNTPKDEEPANVGADPLKCVDEPTSTDHRSFVQNVFGTTAFKMLEWLTPRSLELLSRPEKIAKPAENDTPKPSPKDLDNSKSNDREDKSNAVSAKRSSSKDNTMHGPAPVKVSKEASNPKPSPRNAKAPPGLQDPKSKPASKPTEKRTSSSHLQKKSESTEDHPPKGILSIPSRPDPSMDMTLPQFRPSHTKQKISRQSSTTSPQLHVAEITSITSGKSSSVRIITEPKRASPVSEDDPDLKEEAIFAAKVKIENKPQRPDATRPPPINSPSSPQSMSYLPIELIDFLCDVMYTDCTAEKHGLEPMNIGDKAVKIFNRPYPNLKRRDPGLSDLDPITRKENWRSFIDQSFFGVLSEPDSLLRSFRDSNGQLFDTHTIWYLLLRMTRVAPSIVFHSLWNVAGVLFNLPDKLETVHDWAKPPENTPSSKPLSNQEAAEIMSICLHALVAAAPLVSNARQLANMSRIRSYGLTMLGRDKSSLEPAGLCLAYEDAFTNELALRLARRLFASIPTRRRFSELLDVQNDVRNDVEREPDVLEALLAKLKFLDLEITPVLSFDLDERDLHEKRVPTLLLDWARTVMLQDWQGSAEVPAEGAFGGALALIAAIYKHRKSLLLGDIHFRTEYFAERLDPLAMPLEWIQFESNKRTVHLLDFPYLFNPSTLVTYFRSINYSRMNQAYEVARATSGLMRSIDPEMKLLPDQSARYRLLDRLQTGTSCFMVLEISRRNVLEDTFNAIWRREEREIMRPLKIRLGEEGGEEGMDSGGVQQEFFRLAIAAALDPDYGTFTIDSRTKMTWFQPGSPEPLWKFELIGLIISLAIYNGLTLPVTFPKALYQKLLGEEVSELHHIEDGWPDLANGLTTLLEWDEKDGLVEDIFARTYEFSVEQFGQPISVEMGTNVATQATHWPQFADAHTSANPVDAPMVTNANRNNYVSDYIRFLTDVSIRPQFDAFKKGFFACISPASLTLFTPATLQSILEGIQEIDIAELRRCTRYIGWDASHRTVRDFWSVVKRYDLEHKKKLLEFVTASDRVPVGGMRNLQFTLQRNGIGDGQLPSSYTCYGILLMPEYSGKEVLKEKLGMALENSQGFGFA